MPIDKDNETIDEKINEQVEDVPSDEIGTAPEGTGQEPSDETLEVADVLETTDEPVNEQVNDEPSSFIPE
jgi:hypothetical protein